MKVAQVEIGGDVWWVCYSSTKPYLFFKGHTKQSVIETAVNGVDFLIKHGFLEVPDESFRTVKE